MRKESRQPLHRGETVPIYEYRCQACLHEFEMLRPMDRVNDDVLCLRCKGRALRRLSVIAPVLHGGAIGSLAEAGMERGGACGCGGACSCGASLN
ncbi:MAG: zinc ribbon domain-containing protein [Dehalococcoidia bacterium]|nr:zinc ribbon domain-containing protein [Dehalococcoidia bacterium]